MAENPFYRLAPFIQDFVYRAGWEQLRGIQVKAIQAVFDTPNHVLITSGTASGKTEAAFLPVLTDLYNRPSSTIGVLYIGPLKALINDQFQRLQSLLEATFIPLQSWHGDISQSKKEKFLKKAQGVLQITPESLEAMLIHRSTELGRLFGDLRFVIIDEVHAFISSDRGRQVLCQLQRLARYQSVAPRRIGLSATIGEPELAMQWLAGGTDVPVTLIDDTAGRREVMLGLEYFPELPSDLKAAQQRAQAEGDQERLLILQQVEQEQQAMFEHLYDLSSRQKSLIFANSRGETEEIVSTLRRLAERNKTPDVYHVHHGSISAPLREAAETAMRETDHPAVVSATVTLELGIDIGQLDQVLQVNATHSVSSFVQRLGRSGRRENPAKMFFYCREQVTDDRASLGRRIPWNLLQTLAIIQLYVEEKWIEPPDIPHLPLSLLYHQTMSSVLASTELMPPQLADRVLTLSPFREVTPDHYRLLLRHLINIRHLEKTETGGLIIGLAAEKVVNNYRFYATFEEEEAFQVRDSSREIGTVQDAPPPGERLTLAGHTWEVVEVDKAKRIIYVRRVAGQAPARWTSKGKHLHDQVLKRILRALREDNDYGYLQPRAQKALFEARQLARANGLTRKSLLPLGGHRFMLCPWHGTRIAQTLVMLLERAGIKLGSSHLPFYIEFDGPTSEIGDVRELLRKVARAVPLADELAASLPYDNLVQYKYDPFVPEVLLRETVAQDHLDVKGAAMVLEKVASE